MTAVKNAPRPATAGGTTLRLRAPDRATGTTLHEQVAAEIRRAIANGEAQPGERIPKATDLAAILGVNTNTVLRALRTLQDEGLLELRRRRGITVAATPDEGALIQHARTLVTAGRHLGYSTNQLHDLINRVAATATDRPRRGHA
jgi:GntR family transcriptional regulator